MTPLDCEISFSKYNMWLRTIVSGFYDLQHKGVVKVRIGPSLGSDYPPNALLVRLPNGTLILYDFNDGYNNILDASAGSLERFDQLLSGVDAYFKATYIPAMHLGLNNAHKIRPLGIFSGFHGSAHNPFDVGLRPLAPRTAFRSMIGLSSTLSALTERNNRHMLPDQYERMPDINLDCRAIYVTRLWDPGSPAFKGERLRQEVRELNAFRCAVVRLGRTELGPRFIGGLVPNQFAIENHPEYVMRTPETTNRWSYLRTMRSVAVGVATAGLHSCASGKLAEYIAASRAVVSQTLQAAMPGEFSSPSNYLEAASPGDCVARAGELLDAPTTIAEMMQRNWQYYNTHLRPAAMVLRTLQAATRPTCREPSPPQQVA